MELSIYDASGKQAQRKLILGPGEAARYSVRSIVRSDGLTGTYGGIRISTQVHAGSLDTLHFLLDEDSAFFALLKMFDRDPSVTLAELYLAKTGLWTLRAPMLALATPDGALAFPEGTTLHPQLFVRNATAKGVVASLRFNWHSGANDGGVRGPVLHLNPLETRLVDVEALQKSGLIPEIGQLGFCGDHDQHPP